ncbi:MAG: metallophosphoesterase [Sandaracinaceae bacterium]
MRVLHLSDVHVDVPLAQVGGQALWGKRFIGAANLVLRRGKHFRRVREKVQALDRFRQEQDVDLVLCTGDYTVLGTDPELAAAREVIEPLTRAPLGFVTVPGNHDVYVPSGLGRFEAHFGDLLKTDWPESQVDGVWPLVRLIEDTVAVVCVNSARPNPQPWRSNGRIPDAQIDALREVLRDPRLEGRFVFVLTHFAPRLADGRPDRFLHGLVNADDLLRTCAAVPRGAILHGHVHRCFCVRVPGVGPTLFGAGSTTQEHREGLWVFDIDGETASARQGRWSDDRYVLDDEAIPI